MDDLILVALKASIILTLFSTALSAQFGEMLYLFRHPRHLARAVLAMDVALPLFVALLALAFPGIHPAVQVALVALAVSPVPPLLPRKQLEAGSEQPYVIGLVTAMSVLAILTVPLTVFLFGRAFGVQAHMPVMAVFTILFTTVLAPLVVGAGINYASPPLAARIARPVARGATVLLIAGFLPVLVKAWPVFVTLLGNGTLLALLAFMCVGLLAGHLLGGPRSRDRTALALATSSRHPALAIAIVQINFPGDMEPVVAVLSCLVLGLLVAIPYTHWRRRSGAVPSRRPGRKLVGSLPSWNG